MKLKSRNRTALEEWDFENRGHSLGGTIAVLSKQKASESGSKKGVIRTKVAKHSSYNAKQELERIVNNTPEVAVKITKCSKDTNGIKGYMRYISRDGELELEDHDGLLIRDKKEQSETVKEWSETSVTKIPKSSGYRRESLNIILSMPPETPLDKVKEAAKGFAKKTFPNNPYVFVAHDDTEHPHVHLVVRMEKTDHTRLNPRKADLNNWRRTFAAELREIGISANASTRRARGIVYKKHDPTIKAIDDKAIKVANQLNRDLIKAGKPAQAKPAYSKVTQANLNSAIRVARNESPSHYHRSHQSIKDVRQKVVSEYENLIEELLNGNENDKRLAEKAKTFVENMPPIETRQHKLEKSLIAVREHQLSQSGLSKKKQQNPQTVIDKGAPKPVEPNNKGPRLR